MAATTWSDGMPPGVMRDELHQMERRIMEAMQNGHGILASQIADSDERITHRLDLMNGSIAKAHERLNHQHGVIAAMQHEFKAVRDRWHERINQLTERLASKAHTSGSVVHRDDLKLIIGIILGTASAVTAVIVFILRIAGKM